MNRINPDLFMACFSSWVAECWPDKLDLVAIDGKTSRRSHNRKTGQKPLHLVSAFATQQPAGAGPTWRVDAIVDRPRAIAHAASSCSGDRRN